jgi:lysophospholipase L1-like esterase
MHRIQALLQGDPVKWLFLGDSITHGVVHTFGARDYSQHFAERVRFELLRTQDIVLNTAISGDNTRQLLQSFDWRVGQFTPDAVFLMIGMNDCYWGEPYHVAADEFRANLRELCRRISEFGVPVLQTTCPILAPLSPEREERFDAYMEIIREVATERSVPLIDHTRFWRESAKTDSNRLQFWMSNAFHPNGWGHQAFADLIFRELGIFDPQSLTCRLFRP